MPTFKVVVIGPSGVGKTSLRGQYISARFSSSYRATIGADFITKTLPPIPPSTEPVVLQIWDTAGQERFSSLSSAFFRGADAAVLMYDVTKPQTLYGLEKWWDEFKGEGAVGNKVDLLAGHDAEEVVSPAQGARFVRALIPHADTPPPTPGLSRTLTVDTDEADSDDQAPADDPLASSQLTARPPSPKPISILRHPHLTPNGHRKTHSSSQISFTGGGRPPRAHSMTRSLASSTVTSTLTIYHTPSSSVFSDGASEYYHSAESSAYSHSRSDSDGSPIPNGRGHSPGARSASELTITPERARVSTSGSQSDISHSRDSSATNGPRTNGTGKRSPPVAPIDTSPFAPSNKTPEERARDAGPSSAALSPLPYQRHLPFGAFGMGVAEAEEEGVPIAAPEGKQREKLTGMATTAVSSASAGSSVESLGLSSPETATATGLSAHTPHASTSTGISASASEPKFLLEPDIHAGAGAGHFRVSARTGEGVGDVFGWVARRLVAEWERREREMEFGEAGSRDTLTRRGARTGTSCGGKWCGGDVEVEDGCGRGEGGGRVGWEVLLMELEGWIGL
ncbi:Rab small monomeric GTPase [Mycena kentingensis (nom. inval.)]|nr:Rab small monomeric GTPase [Mycena kentingensis (nom. inval.)]